MTKSKGNLPVSPEVSDNDSLGPNSPASSQGTPRSASDVELEKVRRELQESQEERTIYNYIRAGYLTSEMAGALTPDDKKFLASGLFAKNMRHFDKSVMIAALLSADADTRAELLRSGPINERMAKVQARIETYKQNPPEAIKALEESLSSQLSLLRIEVLGILRTAQTYLYPKNKFMLCYASSHLTF